MNDDPESGVFRHQDVGSASYLNRHNKQMFEEGRSFSGNERDKLWLNGGDGTFADVSDLAGCDDPNDGRATIAADFDDDGDVDLFVHHIQRERHSLHRNDLGTTYGGFVKVRLRATTGHWEAIGATVVADGPRGPVAQVLSRGAGFESCQVPELVFGLGAAESARLRVRWPGGVEQDFGEVAAGGRVLLVEGAEAPEPIEARTVRWPDPLPDGLRVALGDRVPAVSVVDDEDRQLVLDPVALSGGKPLYLNFWASYCAPCVAEIPLLEELHASGDVAVVAISTDAPADSHAAADLLRARGGTFPSYYLGAARTADSEGADIGTLIDLERLAIPTTLVISPEGRVEKIHRGPIRED